MEQIFTPATFTQFGISGLILFFSVYTIKQLYNDMRSDAKLRDDIIKAYLDKVTLTLDNINISLSKLDNKIEKLDEKVINIEKKG